MERQLPEVAMQLAPVGQLPNTTRLNLAIGLPLRNPEELSSLLRQIYDPASPNYHHYLTPDEFTHRFGPAEADYQAVIAFAQTNGLQVTGRHPNRMLLDVSGPVPDIERSLHVKMQMYQHPKEGRTFFAPNTEPALNLGTRILSISGLNDYSRPHSRTSMFPLLEKQNAIPLLGSGPSGYYIGKDFRAAYIPGTTLNGTGQTVGLLELDGYSAGDISYYQSHTGLPGVTLSNVLLDGFNGKPTGNGGEGEVTLDIEMAISMATNLSQVIVYEAGPSGNWHDILNRMATDNLAKQISCSWGDDGGLDAVADQIWQQMAAQGQSFFTASGDDDAYVGRVYFPNETPNITQVGGTVLTTSGPVGTWSSERVWDVGNNGSGGGISTSYSIPSWQSPVSMASNQGSTTKRNSPDVAMVASGIYIRVNGLDYSVDGTSCAAPLWAGFAALVNQQVAAAGRPPIGFVNPAIYSIGLGANYSSAFHDIITGNNESSTSLTKFVAVKGYDLCTGWGTPNGKSLINALANYEPLFVNPATGFASRGGPGGPFTVTSQKFSLTNAGTSAISWTVANTSSWLKVSPSSGTLPLKGSIANVTVSLNASTSNLLAGIYTSTLRFKNVTDGIIQYRPFTLSVLSAPTITSQPTDQAVFETQSASFSVSSDGLDVLSYQWRFNTTNILGATNATLTLTNIHFSQAGNYSVIVSDANIPTISSNAVLTVNPLPPCDPPPAGMISWWSAEGNGNDKVGTNNAMVPAGLAYVSGEVGQGFNLNGTQNRIIVPDAPELNFGANQDFSIEAWVQPNVAVTDYGVMSIVEKRIAFGADDSLNGYAFYLANGQVGCRFWGINFISGPDLRDGKFHHVAVTVSRNSITGGKLYADGVVVLTFDPTALNNSLVNAEPVRIGNHPSLSLNCFFQGIVDEVSIYNKALSPADVQGIYLVGGSGKCVSSVPLTITSEPTNEVVFAGQTVSFNVMVTNALPLSFQWYYNSNTITGATNVTLTLTNVQFAQAGVYNVTVSDSTDFVISSNATLTVNDKLDHFVWSSIPSPQFVNVPFTVMIRAANATNGTFTNFAGSVVLSSINGEVINSPEPATFNQGVWTGLITISNHVANLILRADDGNGESGLANAINIVDLPDLKFSISGNLLLIDWPTVSSDFVLEASPSLLPAQWIQVTNTPSQNGDEYFESIPMNDSNQFFRLRYKTQ